MLKIVEPIRARVKLQWELHGVYTIDAEGYSLEDGSQALYIEDHWERKKQTVEPVLEAGQIIGFRKVSKKL